MTARDRFLRGTDVLHGEQVDQYAATVVALMRAGKREPIGPRFSRAAWAHQDYGRHIVRGLRSAAYDARANLAEHRASFPDAYAPVPFAAMHGPVLLTGALVPDTEPNGHGMTENDRTRWALEHAADELLRAAGESVHRLDIRDPRTHRMTVAPDRVAYRGAPTTMLPESADEARAMSTRARRVTLRSHKVGPRVRQSYRYEPVNYGPDALADLALGRFQLMTVTELETVQLRGRGQRWHILGHGPAVLAPDRIATRKARRARRAVAAGRTAHRAGRPAANPLSADARTIRRRWATASAEQRAAADRIVAVLLTTVPGTVIGTGATAVTVADDCSSASIGRGPLESVHAVARRLALAGTMLAD